jgi:hypothetical protein
MINPDIDRNLFFIWRGLLAWFLLACAVMILTGCTYNRNAPLFSAPLINATGNTTTVPLVP